MVNKKITQVKTNRRKEKFKQKNLSFYTEGGEFFSKEGRSYKGYYRVEDQKIFSGKLKYKSSIELFRTTQIQNVLVGSDKEGINSIGGGFSEEESTIIVETLEGENIYNVDISKKSYNREQLIQLVDTEFKEFFSINNYTVSQFFNIYDELFYNIPVEGNNSHTALVERSNDMLETDIFESERNSLLNQIGSLEDRIVVLENEVPEHPIFINGTFLAATNAATIWYMDRGVRRAIQGFDLYMILLKAADPTQRGLDDTEINGADFIIRMSNDALSQIPMGKPYTYGDLSGINNLNT